MLIPCRSFVQMSHLGPFLFWFSSIRFPNNKNSSEARQFGQLQNLSHPSFVTRDVRHFLDHVHTFAKPTTWNEASSQHFIVTSTLTVTRVFYSILQVHKKVILPFFLPTSPPLAAHSLKFWSREHCGTHVEKRLRSWYPKSVNIHAISLHRLADTYFQRYASSSIEPDRD
jgi:hypothetical protein